MILTNCDQNIIQRLSHLQLTCKDLKLELEQTKFYYQKLIIQMTKGFRMLIKAQPAYQFNTSLRFAIKNRQKTTPYQINRKEDNDKQNLQSRSNKNSQHFVNMQKIQKMTSNHNSERQKLSKVQKKYKNLCAKNNQHNLQKSKSFHSIKKIKSPQALDMIELRNKMQEELIQIKMLQNKEKILDKSTKRMQTYLSQQRLLMNSQRAKSNQNTNKQCLKNSKGKSEVSLTQFKLEDNQKFLENITINSLNIAARQILKEQNKQKNINSASRKLSCPMKHIFYTGSINQNNNIPEGQGKYHKCCNQAPLSLDVSSEIQFYQGEFQNGKFHGQGTITYTGGVKFIGQFYKGKRHGKGCLYLNGKCQIGIWKSQLLVGLY